MLCWESFIPLLCITWKQKGDNDNAYKTSMMFLDQISEFSFSLLKACVLYILRVGVIDQMMEPSQRSFSVFLGKQVLQFNWTILVVVPASQSFTYSNFYLPLCIIIKQVMYFLKYMQLQSSDASPSMKIVALRALSYTLKTLGEVRRCWRKLIWFICHSNFCSL